ncbi:MAG: CHAT domain-containing protein, partial [Gemmatimonadaceae bacterium]
RRTLAVAVADPTAATVTVRLVARPQDEPVRLTSIVVHLAVDGVTRGSAARNVVVERMPGDAPPPDDRGQFWLAVGEPPPAITLAATTARPDVELDIAKPDGNAAGGRYSCTIRNAHGVPVPDESLEMDLGCDARTFAKLLIDQVRLWSGDDLVDNLIENVGATVAAKLPAAFWDTLRAVAALVPDRPLTFQLNSAEPYVPWELALVDPPLDPGRPKYLSAQLIMGRWILGDSSVASPPRPTVVVRTMAVMAGMYSVSTGLRPLPEAQAEAQALTTSYASLPAVPLDCTPANLKSLLDASLTYMFKPVGGVEAVHFAGHGEVDPSRPGEAALYLSNGKALTPLFFRRSRLGAEYAPFIFLNACMVGTAGEMLGDYGGFPGNCLAGGFSGLVAPLWAVNDTVARTFALSFYDEALAEGDSRSVAEVLRDLRANYRSEQPVSSYLAYVYYGNPFLTLSRAAST